MRIFKTRWFHRWANKEGVSDDALRAAVAGMERGLMGVDLGGSVYKKRVPLPGKGKRGSTRTILACRMGERAFFIFGFAKNRQSNIDLKEVRAIKLLAHEFFIYNEDALKKALDASELVEISYE